MKPALILPPHDETAEAGALACVLLAEVGALLDQLDEADFYDLRHKAIFRALLSLQADNRPLTTVELPARLKEWGEVDDAGGLRYLMDLPDTAPSAANFPSFITVLKAFTRRRAMLAEADSLRQHALDLSIPVQAAPGLLEGRRFDPAKEPPPLQAVYTLAGHVISTPGNLTTITSAVKTGKSAVIGAMAAAALPHKAEADLLKFNSTNPKSRALVWLDSEQSQDDFWHCVNRAIRRAGIENPPAWLCAFCLTGLGALRSLQAAKEAIRRCRDSHGGLHSILLDGVADFVLDVNDPAESNAFVAELHGLAAENDCPIISVIHFNPGTEKARGHLGSQLERKAETNLRLDKVDGVTVIWGDKQRRAPIPKHAGPCFRWDDGSGMHVSTESPQAVVAQDQRAVLESFRDEVFGDHAALNYSNIVTTIMKRLKVSESTAHRKLTKLSQLGLVQKSVAGLWIKGNR